MLLCRRALLFEHKIFHAGAVVTGGVKYTIRTDIEYGPESVSVPPLPRVGVLVVWCFVPYAECPYSAVLYFHMLNVIFTVLYMQSVFVI